MKLVRYLVALAVVISGIAIAVELGLRAFMPDSYRGYLVDLGDDQVTWRLGPYEPSQPASGYNTPVSLIKPANTLRIVALGTSSTEGWLTAETVYKKYGRTSPTNRISSYSTAFEFILNDMASVGSKQVEVINLGIAAYNVSDVIRMVKDAQRLDPDFMLIQIGGNETWTAERSKWASYISEDLPYLQTELAYEVFTEVRGGWSTLSRGGDAFNPMALFSTKAEPVVAEPPGRAVGLEQRLATYRTELDRLGTYLRGQDVPFLLQVPATNLADYQPFGSMAKPDTDPEQIAELNRLLIAALEDRTPGAKAKYEEIIALDDGIAEANYQLGRILLNENRPEEARKLFWKAVDRDLVLKRLPGTFKEVSLEFLTRNDFLFVDELSVLEVGTDTGVLGYNRLDDDVHPDIEGQFILATEFARIVLEQGFLPADAYSADPDRDPTYEDYLTHLGYNDTAAGEIAYLKAAHNYLTFGRFRQRLRWDPRPDVLLQFIVDELAIANAKTPDDASRYLGTVLNLYLGRTDEAAELVAALDCRSSAEQARRTDRALVDTSRRALGGLSDAYRARLNDVLTAEGCRQ